MASIWTQLARDLGDRLDTDLPARLSDSLAIDPTELRADLNKRRLSYLDPATGHRPTEEALALTAEHLIRRATRSATISGAVGGMAGMAGVPPEVAWHLVQLLRLAQRLMLVYGHNPEDDRGRLLAQRAMAACFEIDLPTQGGVGLRVRDLPSVLRDNVPTAHQGATWLAQAAVRQTAKAVLRPIGRSVPGLASGPAAWRARQSMRNQAERMLTVIQRASAGPQWADGSPTEAVEVQ